MIAIALIQESVCVGPKWAGCHTLMNMASYLNRTDATFFFLSYDIEFAYI